MYFLYFIFGIILVYFLFFRVIHIQGMSMYPTYRHGEYAVVTSIIPGHKFKVGNIYVYKVGERYVCKRLTEISEPEIGNKKLLYFLGDNPSESYDSRDYGYITEDRIKYRFLKSRHKEVTN